METVVAAPAPTVICRDSWSYQIAKNHGDLNDYLATEYGLDICTFRRHLIKGLLCMFMYYIVGGGVVLSLALTLISGWLTYTGHALYCAFTSPAWTCLTPTPGSGPWETLLGIGMCTWFVILIFLTKYLSGKGIDAVEDWIWRRNRKNSNSEKETQPKEPNGFVLAWRSWKEKVCYKVDFQ